MVTEKAPSKLLNEKGRKRIVCATIGQSRNTGLTVVVLTAALAEWCTRQTKKIFPVESCHALYACSYVLIGSDAVVSPNGLRLPRGEDYEQREEKYCTKIDLSNKHNIIINYSLSFSLPYFHLFLVCSFCSVMELTIYSSYASIRFQPPTNEPNPPHSRRQRVMARGLLRRVQHPSPKAK